MERRLDGISRLRDLGTREASLALLDAYRPDTADGAVGLPLHIALLASPHRAALVEALEARVDAGVALSPRLLGDLTELRLAIEGTTGVEPETQARFRSLIRTYHARWLQALTRAGAAGGAVTSVLRAAARQQDAEVLRLVRDWLADRPVAAADALLALSPSDQATLLQHRWPAVDGDWIRPALEALVRGWRGDHRFAGAGDAALTRLMALDPPAGQALLLEEVATGRYGLAPATVTALLDRPLAGQDDALAARLRAAGSFAARAAALWLIADHGSAALRPLVDGVRNGITCPEETPLIAFLLKHDVTAARARLSPDFDRRAICRRIAFDDLARLGYWDDTLEDALTQWLRRDDVVYSEPERRQLGALCRTEACRAAAEVR